MSTFENAFKVIVGEEGGLSTNPADPGNWTGGACGRGVCRGTRFGIAAADHPDLDIASLSLEEARTIYQTSYWDPVHGSDLPSPLALLVFDAAVNCGVTRAVRWLQTAARCPADGTMGEQTLAAIAAVSNGAGLCAEFQALRLTWMAALPTWRVFGLGWARRLCSLSYASITYGDP